MQRPLCNFPRLLTTHRRRPPGTHHHHTQSTTTQVWGIDGRTLPIDLYDFKSIYLAGRVPLSRSGMGVADLPAFGLIGYGNRPVGVVGMDMMSGATDPSGRRIVFDFRHNMLYCA